MCVKCLTQCVAHSKNSVKVHWYELVSVTVIKEEGKNKKASEKDRRGV